MVLNRYSVTFIHNSLKHHQVPPDMTQKAHKRHHQEGRQESKPTNRNACQHEGRLQNSHNRY